MTVDFLNNQIKYFIESPENSNPVKVKKNIKQAKKTKKLILGKPTLSGFETLTGLKKKVKSRLKPC